MMKKLTITMIISILLVAMLLVGCAPKAASPSEQAAEDSANLASDEYAGSVVEDVVDSVDDEMAREEVSESDGLSPLQDGIATSKEEPENESFLTDDEADDSLFFNDDEFEMPEPWEYPNNNEEYGDYIESAFLSPFDAPLSTFSIDVDTASYSNMRRYLENGEYMPKDAVRIEEFVNYFSYDYDLDGSGPIGVGVTISDCPWNEDRYLARVVVQADELDLREAPDSNIVFLLDVSGSMSDADKLPLVKAALTMLTENLSDNDRVSIVVYAGSSGLVLDGARGSDTKRIERALTKLKAGGSTAGGAGIDLAYAVAEHYFIEGGNNRIILCSDGDFNVGPQSLSELEQLIERKREGGVFLSVLGFGEGNIKDTTMETLADKGNGNYSYIDSLMEAKKVLVNEMTSTLYTVAKDVKIQVEFNPAAVASYRLVGYDNRRLNPEDFNDDKKDAGEMGAGHTVTVFYEIILVGSKDIDDLVFQSNNNQSDISPASDWMYVKTRYKLPDEDHSRLITLMAGEHDYTSYPDNDFLFASAVAEFALILKDSQYKGEASFSSLIERARDSRGYDADGYRSQFLQLAELAYEMYR